MTASSARIRRRQADPQQVAALADAGIHPVLSRVLAARGVASPAQLEYELRSLLPPDALKGVGAAAVLLADAIAAGRRLLIVADYDADGATACAVGIRALRAFGAQVEFLVPNRFTYGYGLTPEIVRLAAQRQPQLLITVDNGIASVEGVSEASRLGIPVLITDHHLPGTTLPDAAGIVNPNQPGCLFPSKHLAGVGVMFYTMLALRAEMRRRGDYAPGQEPNLARLLDLVALGTVADVVRLDSNNRVLVAQGLKRIREGKACPGILALFRVAGRDPARANTFDLGFMGGPRLNAAGRLDDMSIGIECLVSDDGPTALRLAQRLDALNRERRDIEGNMQDAALADLSEVAVGPAFSLCLFRPEWHQGVVGIVASRLKDRFHRPAIVFARGGPGELKGSGRSISGLNLRDVLDLVDKRHPGLITRFGGHAAAAGLSLRETDLAAFSQALENVVRGLLAPEDLELVVESDGGLAPEELDLRLAQLLQDGIWGQGFPEPLFANDFQVLKQRVVGERHLKLRLAAGQREVEAMLFAHADPLPSRIHALYRLAVNEWNGTRLVQLNIQHWWAIDAPGSV